jgi:hypothetical protein
VLLRQQAHQQLLLLVLQMGPQLHLPLLQQAALVHQVPQVAVACLPLQSLQHPLQGQHEKQH